MAAWYDTVADYTAVPFARGALFDGAQFLNWGLGKILPRAVYPEEYERMNAASIERGKEILFPYKSAGDGKGNAVTSTLEFVAGMYGGGAVMKVGLKGVAKTIKAAPSAGRFMMSHAPKLGKIVKVTSPNAQTAAGSGATGASKAGTIVSGIKTAVNSLAKDGSIKAGEKLAGYLGDKGIAGYRITGPLVTEVGAGVVNNAVPGMITGHLSGSTAKNMEALAASARNARDSFYRSQIGGAKAAYTTFAPGGDAGAFLRAARDESARIGKLTDAQVSALVPPDAKSPSVPETYALKDDSGAGSHLQMMQGYRDYGRSIPGLAIQAVRDAYKDNPDGYRALIDEQVDRIITASFPSYFKNGEPYNPKTVYGPEISGRIKGLRDKLLESPDSEAAILMYNGGSQK